MVAKIVNKQKINKKPFIVMYALSATSRECSDLDKKVSSIQAITLSLSLLLRSTIMRVTAKINATIPKIIGMIIFTHLFLLINNHPDDNVIMEIMGGDNDNGVIYGFFHKMIMGSVTVFCIKVIMGSVTVFCIKVWCNIIYVLIFSTFLLPGTLYHELPD